MPPRPRRRASGLSGVRMVATDLDGTLLSPEGIVSGRTAEAVRAARAVGIHVLPATGRPPGSVWDIASAGGLGPLGVCSNGAVLVDFETAAIIEADRLGPAEAVELVRIIRAVDPGVHFAIDNLDRFTHEREFFEMVVDWDEEIAVVDDIIAALGDGAVKLIARRPGWHAVETIGRVQPVVGARADLTTSGLDWIDVGLPLVSKASRLDSACTRLGVDPDQVVAIGDNHNDLAMLAWAGTSMAVANAVPEVLAVVDRVLPTNADHGVAAFLEELVAMAADRPPAPWAARGRPTVQDRTGRDRGAAPGTERPGPIRLIAVDMDGTLLDPQGELSPGAAASVARARARGLHVVPVTGRPDRIVWDIAAQAGLGPLGVCANGAVLIDLEAGTVITRVGFSGAEAVALVDLIRDRVPGVALAADQGDRFVHERSVLEGLDLAPSRGRMLTRDIRDRVGDGCLKFVARRSDLTSLELAALLAPVLRADRHADLGTAGVGRRDADPPPGAAALSDNGIGARPGTGPAEAAGMDRVASDDLAEVTASDIAWVDIGPPGLTKATGLADVCRRLGVGLEEVAALGDHFNDLPMLRAAGLAGAMGNAIAEVLAVADVVVGTNADGGAAAFIDRIVDAGGTETIWPEAPPAADAPPHVRDSR